MENNRENTLELVKKASAGDISAFEELYSMKLRTILYHIGSLIRSSDEAEDVAQEVGIRIFQNLPDLKAPEAFHVWMQRIITNECYKHTHKKSRLKTYANIDDYTDTVEEENKEFLPDEYAEAADSRKIILNCIEKLPPQRKRIIIMYYYDDMSYKDIASALALSVSTVSTSIMKAKKMIKNELEKKSAKSPGRAASLPAMTVVGKVIALDANTMFPQAKIDSIAHSVSHMVMEGGAAAAGTGAAVKAGLSAVVGPKVIAAAVAVVIVVTGSTFVIRHSDEAARNDPAPAVPAATIPAAEEALPADLKITYTGGECACGHLNPKNAEMSETIPAGYTTAWRIVKVKGEKEVAAGTGTDVSAPLKSLLDGKKDGTYKLIYINTSEAGSKVTLNREFVIDTGDKTNKHYQ
jgi:RNA polymerase sigma factor (sigma-70 family)